MDIRKLQRAIVDGLEDVKAQNIVVFNTEHLSPLFERVIIASGTSNRQTKALASSVRETVKGRGMQVMRTEGEDNGEWIIVDCGAAVVHVMQPAIRDYYHLEEIWGDKPVKLKVGSGETKLVKASEDTAAKPAAKKKAVSELGPVGAKKAPAKKAAAKTPAKKAAPAKKGVSRVVGSKTPATKTVKVGATKPAAKKTAAKSAPVKKAAPAKKAAAPAKTAAKKVVAKKAPAKKAAAKKA
ncbi:ribosome silencing factor [Roseateles asaccharophilus]|uniref:Ribosomal silencing factor RsfS n=1 Tax=Roseateles asaccharophilus TaxID=582607 RepID=A0ABU2AFR4_9BURK|nr:ribosome silencing factor [Roseateles asaccharophilus]MDR7336069.1 ribosome-associated protein [Roseateles asaccharophilus]